MQILEELWNGEICPISQTEYRSDDYRDLVLIFEKNEEKLLPTMTDAQKELYQKQADLVEEMRNLAECGAFMTGFRLAVQLMAASVIRVH